MGLSFSFDQVNALLESSVSILSKRRNNDSSYKGAARLRFTWAEMQEKLQSFYYNYGRMSDGASVRIPGDEIYVAITVDLSVWSERDKVPTLQIVKDRSTSEFPSVFLYVNGLKIPDAKVYIYATESNTNIMFPVRYLKDGVTNEVFVEKRTFSVSQYINSYDGKSVGGTILGLPVLSSELTILEQNYTKRNPGYALDYNTAAMVFINGLLLEKSRRDLAKRTNAIDILIRGITIDPGVEVELYIDPAIVFINDATISTDQSKMVFGVTEGYQDPADGPISEYASLFFMEGKRISNDDVSQDGLLHFTAPIAPPRLSSGTIIVTDQDLSNNAYTYYGEDYFLYNFIGSGGISQILGSKNANEWLDGHVDYARILSDNGVRFTDTTVNAILESFNNAQNNEARVRSILNNVSGAYRNFLDLFKKNSEIFTVAYNGDGKDVYIGLQRPIAAGETISYDVNVRGVHVPVANLKLVRRGLYQSIGVPARYFTKGVNTVEISYWSNIKRKFNPISVPISALTVVNDNYRYSFNTPEGVTGLEDLTVIRKIQAIADRIYAFPQSQVGFEVIDGLLMTILPNGQTTIEFPRSSVNSNTEIIIYSKKFVTHYTTQVQYIPGEPVEDLFVPIFNGTELNPMPLLSSGKILVYAEGQPLQEGLDYFYRSFEDTDAVTYSAIVIRNRYYELTNIDIFFTGVSNKVIWSIEGVYENKYGLMYIGDLEFPFSKNYMTVKVDGVRLLPGDYDVLSDKLIRVYNAKVPFQNITIETEFSEDYEDVIQYAGSYVPDSLENRLATLFRGVDYKDRDANEVVPDSELVYESFVEEVDSVGRVPNGTRATQYATNRVDLYIYSYLNWLLKSGETKSSLIVPQYFADWTMRRFEVFMNEIIPNRDVVISAKQDLLRDFVTTEQNYLTSYSDRIQYMVDWLLKYGGALSKAYDRYKNSPESNLFYEWDMVPILDTKNKIAQDVVLGYRPNTLVTKEAEVSVVAYTEKNSRPAFLVVELDGVNANSGEVNVAALANVSHYYDLSRAASPYIGRALTVSSLLIHDGEFFITPSIYSPMRNDPVSAILRFDGDEARFVTNNSHGIATGEKSGNSRVKKTYYLKEATAEGELLIVSAANSLAGSRSITSDINETRGTADSEYSPGGSGLQSATEVPPTFAVIDIKKNAFRKRFQRIAPASQFLLRRTTTMLRTGTIIGMNAAQSKVSNQTSSLVYRIMNMAAQELISCIVTTSGLYRRIIFKDGLYYVDEFPIFNSLIPIPPYVDWAQNASARQVLLTKDGLIFRRTPEEKITVDSDLFSRTKIVDTDSSKSSQAWTTQPAMFGKPQDSNLVVDLTAFARSQSGATFNYNSCMMDYDIARRVLSISIRYTVGSKTYTACALYDVATKNIRWFTGFNSAVRGVSLQMIKKTTKYDFSSMDIFTSLVHIDASTSRIIIWGRTPRSGVITRIYVGMVPRSFTSLDFNELFSVTTISPSKLIVQFKRDYAILSNDGVIGPWKKYPRDNFIDKTITATSVFFGVFKNTNQDVGSIFYLNESSFDFEAISLVDGVESIRSVWADHGGLYIVASDNTTKKVYLYRFDPIFRKIFKNTIRIGSITYGANANTPNSSDVFVDLVLGSASNYKIYRSHNEYYLINYDTSKIYRSKNGINFLSFDSATVTLVPAMIPFYRGEKENTICLLGTNKNKSSVIRSDDRIRSYDGLTLLSEISNFDELSAITKEQGLGVDIPDMLTEGSMKPFLIEGMFDLGITPTSKIGFFQSDLPEISDKSGIDGLDSSLVTWASNYLTRLGFFSRVGERGDTTHRMTKVDTTSILEQNAIPLGPYGMMHTVHKGLFNSDLGVFFPGGNDSSIATSLYVPLKNDVVLYQPRSSSVSAYLIDKTTMTSLKTITPINFAVSPSIINSVIDVISLAGGSKFIIGGILYIFDSVALTVTSLLDLRPLISAIVPNFSFVYPTSDSIDYSEGSTFLVRNNSTNPYGCFDYYKVTIGSANQVTVVVETALNQAIQAVRAEGIVTQKVKYSPRSNTYLITSADDFWLNPTVFDKARISTPYHYEVLYTIGGTPNVKKFYSGFELGYHQLKNRLYIFHVFERDTLSVLSIFTINPETMAYEFVRSMPTPWSALGTSGYANIKEVQSEFWVVENGDVYVYMNRTSFYRYRGTTWTYLGSNPGGLGSANYDFTVDAVEGRAYLIDRRSAPILVKRWNDGSASFESFCSLNESTTFAAQPSATRVLRDSKIVWADGMPNLVSLVQFNNANHICIGKLSQGINATEISFLESGMAITNPRLDKRTLLTPNGMTRPFDSNDYINKYPDRIAGTIYRLPAPLTASSYGMPLAGEIPAGYTKIVVRAKAGKGSVKGTGSPRLYIYTKNSSTWLWNRAKVWDFQEATEQEWIVNLPADGAKYYYAWFQYASYGKAGTGNSIVETFYIGDGSYDYSAYTQSLIKEGGKGVRVELNFASMDAQLMSNYCSKRKVFQTSDTRYLTVEPDASTVAWDGYLEITGFRDNLSPLQYDDRTTFSEEGSGLLIFEPLFFVGDKFVGLLRGKSTDITIRPSMFPYLVYKDVGGTRLKVVKNCPPLNNYQMDASSGTSEVGINPNSGLTVRTVLARSAAATNQAYDLAVVVIQEDGEEFVELVTAMNKSLERVDRHYVRFAEPYTKDKPVQNNVSLAGTQILSSNMGLFYSIDGGANWKLQGTSEGLINPNVYTAQIELDEYIVRTDVGNEVLSGTSILVTDQGVFYSSDKMQTWKKDTSGLFNSVINSFYSK